jgi:hypothetical protein
MKMTRASIIPNYYIDCFGFDKVHKHEHMFKRLGLKGNYLAVLVKNLENHLYEQDPGSIISKIVLTNAPEFKTGLIHAKDDQSQGIIKGVICKLTVTMDIDVYISSSLKENFIFHVKYTFHGQDLDNEQKKVKQDIKITGEDLVP